MRRLDSITDHADDEGSYYIRRVRITIDMIFDIYDCDNMIKRRFDISTNSITKCKYYLLRIKLSITDYLITDGPVILNISNFKLY